MTVLLMDAMDRHRPQARRRRTIWSITGRPSTKTWNGRFASPACFRSDRRLARVPQESVQLLLSQHCEECCEQRGQQTGTQETRDGDDLAGRDLLNGRNGRGFAWDWGLVEGEEDGAEECHRLVVGGGLELGTDVDDEGRADCREQTGIW